MRPTGARPWRCAASSEARIIQAAPSVICELLPGVTLPYLRSKKGLSFARFSIDESRRTPSSSGKVAPSASYSASTSPPPGASRPSSWARAAR